MDVPNLFTFKFSIFLRTPFIPTNRGMNLPPQNYLISRTLLALSLLMGFTTFGLGSTVLAQTDSTEGHRLGDIIIHIIPQKDSPDDGYWKWLPTYVEASETYQQEIDDIRRNLAVRAKDQQDLRAKWTRLFRMEYISAGMVLGDEGVFDIEIQKRGDVLEFFFGNVGQHVKGNAKTFPRLKKKRDRLSERIGDLKLEQRELINTALSLHDRLIAKVEVRLGLTDNPRPQTKRELQSLKDSRSILEIELYDAAEWYREDELLRLINAIDLKNQAKPEVRKLLTAKGKLATATRIENTLQLQQVSTRGGSLNRDQVEKVRILRLEALEELRNLVKQKPVNPTARAMMRKEELYWLRMVSAKLMREKQMNLAAFSHYLDSRGFYEGEPKDWWEGTKEVMSTYFGLGPIALVAGLSEYDVPGAQAELVDQVQTQTAKNLVALNAIFRLVKHGVPLVEIPTITAERLSQVITLRKVDAKPLGLKQSKGLVRDIVETVVELPDLKALTNQQAVYFVEDVIDTYETSYFGALDSDYHAYELVGDVFSLKNILTFFGPSTILQWKAGNSWFWPTSGAEMAVLFEEGATIGGAVFRGARLDKFAEALARTSAGRGLLRAHALDQKYLATIGGAAAEAYHSGKWIKAVVAGSVYGTYRATELVGLFGTMFTAHWLADQSGIPGAVLLVDLIMAFETHEYFWLTFKKTGTPLLKISNRIDDLATHVARQKQIIQDTNRMLDEFLETGSPGATTQLGKKARSGTSDATLPPGAGRGTAQTSTGQGTTATGSGDATLPPGGGKGKSPAGTGETRPPHTIQATADELIPHSPTTALEHATIQFVEAVQRGDIAEAKRIAKAAKIFSKEALEGLDEVSAKIAAARKRLASRPPNIDEVPKPKSHPKLIKDDTGKPHTNFFNKDMYGDGTDAAGLALRRAEAQLYEDTLDEALESYRIAYRMELDSPAPNEARLEYIRERMALTANAKKTRMRLANKRKNSPPLTAKDPIKDDPDVEYIFSEIKAGNAEVKTGSANTVLIIKKDDEPVFYVKRYTIRGESDPAVALELARQKAEAEVMGSLLMNEMGQNAPATRIIEFPDGSFGLAARSVKGTKLEDLTESQLVAIRKAYGEQRAIRANMGDGDGHYANVVVDEHGNVWNLDFDQATGPDNVSGLLGGYHYETDEQVIEGSLRFAHGRPEKADQRILLKENAAYQKYGPVVRTYNSYGWMARADQLIKLDDILGQITKLEQLKNPAFRKALRDKFIAEGMRPTQAQDMVDALGNRASVLRDTLTKETMFGSGPIDISLLFKFMQEHFARSDNPEINQHWRVAA